MQQIRNVFIPHTHEDDEGVKRLKSLLELHGMTCRNGSITLDKFNGAQNEDYIKYQILAPRIRWAGAIAVYVSPDTQYSKWVNWEIEYAHKQGKRIVGVWERGERGCDLPEALDRYADAIVGWDGEHIIEAIEGAFNGRSHSVLIGQHQKAEREAETEEQRARRWERIKAAVLRQADEMEKQKAERRRASRANARRRRNTSKNSPSDGIPKVRIIRE